MGFAGLVEGLIYFKEVLFLNFKGCKFKEWKIERFHNQIRFNLATKTKHVFIWQLHE